MPTIHERVDTLEDVLRRFIINTQRFEDEMRAFKEEMRLYREESERDRKALHDEMTAFKEEMRAFKERVDELIVNTEKERRRMNKQWGEIANKMGTIVEELLHQI